MANPNPSIETRFTTENSESLTDKITLRITPSMKAALDVLGDARNNFVRDAIANALNKKTA